jgi:superoxide reductase
MKNVHKCSLCGNVIEVEYDGGGPLVCCGKPMIPQKVQTADKTLEKHVPVIERQDDGYLVTVGSTLHPMEDKHYIMWIDLVADGVIHRRHLKPGDAPKAFFAVPEARDVSAYEYCNLHGLWEYK